MDIHVKILCMFIHHLGQFKKVHFERDPDLILILNLDLDQFETHKLN